MPAAITQPHESNTRQWMIGATRQRGELMASEMLREAFNHIGGDGLHLVSCGAWF
jgi:hypothetical protein